MPAAPPYRFLSACVLVMFVVGTSRVADAQPAPPVPPVPLAKDRAPLPGTGPLAMEGDIASAMVEGIDRFLLGEIGRSEQRRDAVWEDAKWTLDDARKRLRHILGVRDERVPYESPEYVSSVSRPSLVAKVENGYEIHAIRWPVFGQVHGEGLLIVPTDREPVGSVVLIPDASETPEQLAGLVEGTSTGPQYGRELAEAGCRVIIPTVINRDADRKARLTNREFLYRSAFELGRHLIGYEVQKVLAAVDWLGRGKNSGKVGVFGRGEGGMLALYAGALDERIDVTSVTGYVGDRRNIWREPIDRNVFGLLERFGDSELIAMIRMDPRRRVLISPGPAPTLTIPPGGPGAPATLVSPSEAEVNEQIARARRIVAARGVEQSSGVAVVGAGREVLMHVQALAATGGGPSAHNNLRPVAKRIGELPDAKARHARQLDELDRHNQQLLATSAEVRRQYMAKLDTSSVEKHAATVEPYRKAFYEEVIGKFDQPLLPFNARSRKTYEAEKWVGYEVVLDVFPDVFAYGLLLLPKDLKEGERRPVVVCQHGLEGRPQDVIGPEKYSIYKAFAAQLAERGFITFAPQNPYIFKDRFRTLQRKANPLGKTLFSIIVPQHQQIVNWLKTLPNVDEKRIAFYGLSYGGKTAMRVPAIVTDYCLSICSADFNEWVWKNASSRDPKYSYVFTGEYEIFEWDLGSTFNYAEMAALIAPRPFMVERGHFDNVAPDEMVAYEYAKVRRLYAAQLGIGDRTEIEWFVGPHSINGKGTFEFLHKHLNWPKRD